MDVANGTTEARTETRSPAGGMVRTGRGTGTSSYRLSASRSKKGAANT